MSTSATASATSQLGQLAAAMAQQSSARAEQATRTFEAQQAANEAAEARITALSAIITQLQAQFAQYKSDTDAEIATLKRTVATQATLIDQLTPIRGQLDAHLHAYREHTHGFDRPTGVSYTVPAGQYVPAPYTLRAPERNPGYDRITTTIQTTPSKTTGPN